MQLKFSKSLNTSWVIESVNGLRASASLPKITLLLLAPIMHQQLLWQGVLVVYLRKNVGSLAKASHMVNFGTRSTVKS
jgi:hypothetical protein